MRRFQLSFVMAVALLLPMALSHPASVSAKDCGLGIFNILCELGSGLDIVGTDCPIEQFEAKATSGGSVHSYDYATSPKCGSLHFSGVYNVAAKEAREKITGYTDGTITAVWTCSDDPWIYLPGQRPTCTRISFSDPALNDLYVFPIGVTYLSDYRRQALRSLLQTGSTLPCGVSDIKVTINRGVAGSIYQYDYVYYCIDSYRFQVSALYDTRPVSDNPADSDRHRAFEQMKDGDTVIIMNWRCPSDPWGYYDGFSSCTPAGTADVQHPNPNFPVSIGSLPLSVRYLDDSARQALAAAFLRAHNLPVGSVSPGDLAQPAPLPKPPAAPANFNSARDNGSGLTIILRWDPASGADYYYLTASSHNGDFPVALGGDTPKLGKDVTQFTVGSGDNAANIVGGVDFKLQACNAGGCSAQVIVTTQ